MTAFSRVRAPLAAAANWGLPARLALLLLGLALYGLALRLILDAQVGVAPWDVLHTGLAERYPLTVGQAGILLGTVIVACNRLLLDQPIGVGTALNAALVGAFILAGRLVRPGAAGRQTQLESRAAAGVVGHADLDVQDLRQAAHDGEPEPQPVVTAVI